MNKKNIIIGSLVLFISFLYFNFSKPNAYNSYARNIYYSFLNIFNKNKTLKVNYSNDDLEIMELRNSIEELKKLKGIKTVLADYEIINASVISRSLVGWFDTLVIDKGSNDGIEEGESVTNHEALIGTIVEVMPSTSVVRLITNNQNKVSAKIIGKENVFGLIYEYKDNHLTMQGLKNTDIEIGSKVVTTGMSYIYPAGIYIGEVLNVVYDDFKLTPIVYIKTPVDFNDILYVSVLKR